VIIAMARQLMSRNHANENNNKRYVYNYLIATGNEANICIVQENSKLKKAKDTQKGAF